MQNILKPRIKVLMIEDSRSEAMVAELAILQADDGRIEIVTSGDLASGLAELENGFFDAVVLDLMLPDSDGMKSVALISGKYPELPIIVHSSNIDELDLLRCLEGGVQEYLLKGEVSGPVIRHAIFSAMFRHSLKKKA